MWTKERPTKTGWYWFRQTDPAGEVRFMSVVEVVTLHGRLHMSESGDLPLSQYNQGAMQGFEWQGPIHPVE